jgi:hypothetical protein
MSFITQRPSNQAVREAQGKRILSLTAPLLRTTNPAGAGRVATIEVQNPSARLTGQLSVFFEPDGVQEQNITGYGAAGGAFGYFGSAWDLWAATPGVNGGSLITNRVESVQALPHSYEWDSNAKIVRATVTLSTPQTGAAVPVAGTWYARVYWEPTIDFVANSQELIDLFSACSFAVQ